MIKKLLLFLSFTMCMTTAAFSENLIAPPILRIYIHPEILRYGISHYIDEQYANAAADTYQNLMWDDGSVTNDDLNAVCKAGHLENDKCSEFKKFIVGGFHESCGQTKGQPNEHCIDNVFYNTLSGIKVTMLQADGLSKEYIRVKHSQEDVVCSNNFRTHNLNDFVKCRTADGKNYYEFKFDSVEKYAELTPGASINAAICKIHDIDYKPAHYKVGGKYIYNQCVTSDANVCANINKSASKFALKTDMEDGICIIRNKHHLTPSNLRTAFGIDNKAFITGYQFSAYAGMRDQLCDYIKANANTQITTCECEYSMTEITDNSNALTMATRRDDVLTCYANDQPIDFVFDDLNEGGKKVQKGGLEAFNCAVVGGTYQGQECFSPDESLCRKIAAATIKNCPECQKAYFDTTRNACILPNSAIANEHQKRVNTGLIIGGTIVGAVITFVTGGTFLGVSAVLVETVGGVMEYGAQIHIDGIADEFFEKANNCDKATCAEEILKEFFLYLSRMPNDLQDGEKLGVDAQMERLIELLPDDSQFLTDMVAACYERGGDDFDISQCDDGVWNADQVIRAVGIALQFTSIFVSVGEWVLGAKTIKKITEKAPRLTKALQRKIPGVQKSIARRLAKGQKVVRSDGKHVDDVLRMNKGRTSLEAKHGWNVLQIENRLDASHSVFKFTDNTSGKIYYLKHASVEEVNRTKRAYQILEQNSDIVHGVKVVEEDQSVLTEFAKQHNITSSSGNYWFIMESAPSSETAFNLANAAPGDDVFNTVLRGKKITLDEQTEILSAVKKMNDNGIVHGDLGSNMFFMREPNGKLRVDIIDYEILNGSKKTSDIDDVEDMFRMLKESGMAEDTQHVARTSSEIRLKIYPDFDEKIANVKNGSLPEFYVVKNDLSDEEWRILREELKQEGLEINDVNESLFSVKKSTGNSVDATKASANIINNVNQLDAVHTEILERLEDITGVTWEYKTAAESGLSQGVYRVNMTKLTEWSDEGFALENKLRHENVRFEYMTEYDGKYQYLVIREENIGDIGRIKPTSVIIQEAKASGPDFLGNLKGWDIQSMEQVRANYRNSVFKFTEAKSGKTYYLKHVPDMDEITRTKKAYDILGNQSDIVHTVKVIEDDQNVLIDFAAKNDLLHSSGEYWVVLEEVPTSKTAHHLLTESGSLQTVLDGKKLTLAEQKEISRAVDKLNAGGIMHGDLEHNMFLMREPNGKLRVDIIDYEPVGGFTRPQNDKQWLQNTFQNLANAGLAEKP